MLMVDYAPFLCYFAGWSVLSAVVGCLLDRDAGMRRGLVPSYGTELERQVVGFSKTTVMKDLQEESTL